MKMKVKRKLYGGILCLAVVTALVAVTVKTDFFKYVYAHTTLGDGWSMNDDGTIKCDAPPLKRRTRMLRSLGTDYVDDFDAITPEIPMLASNGENSEP